MHTQWQLLLTQLPKPVVRRLLFSVSKVLRDKILNETQTTELNTKSAEPSRLISGAAATLQPLFSVLGPEDISQAFSTLTQLAVSSTALLRALVVAATDEQQDILLEKAWTQFSDRLMILHSPMIQQESKYTKLWGSHCGKCLLC